MNRRMWVGAIACALAVVAIVPAAPAQAVTASWTVDDVPPPGTHSYGSLRSVSCATATYCLAVGQADDPMANIGSGTNWTLSVAPRPAGTTSAGFADVSCVSTTFCIAVGDTTPAASLAERWDGSAWTLQTSPLKDKAVAVSCVSTQFCMAASATGSQVWNGNYWRRLPAWAAMKATDLSCSSATRCLAVGNSVTQNRGAAFAWDGTQWADVTPGSIGIRTQLGAVDCVATTCVVGGRRSSSSGINTFVGQYVGTHWESVGTVASSTVQLQRISCRGATRCFGIGVDYQHPGIGVLVMIGTTWTVAPHVPAPNEFAPAGIDCRVTATCVVATGLGTPQIFNRTTNGGWTDGHAVGPVTPDDASVSAISCVAQFCAAVGDSSAAEWDGSTWTAGPLPSPSNVISANGVSCTSASSCVAVGMSGLNPVSWLWDGTAWTLRNMLANRGMVPNSVSCVSATDCLAIGDGSGTQGGGQAPAVEHFDGQAWSVVPAPFGGTNSSLASVSCVSSTFCAAVGYFGRSTGAPVPTVSIWNGSSWTVTNYSGFFPRAISCVSTAFCMAVGQSDVGQTDDAVTTERYDGSSWIPVSVPQQSNPEALGVSCASSTNCLLVNGSASVSSPRTTSAATWDGTAWTATQPATPPDASNGFGLSSVSCTSSFCRAAGYESTDTTYSAALVETLS